MISFLCSSVQIVDLTACLYLTCNLPCCYFLNVYCHVLDFDLWCEPAFVLDVNLEESAGFVFWWMINRDVEVCRQVYKNHCCFDRCTSKYIISKCIPWKQATKASVLTANQRKMIQGYKSVSIIGDSTESLQRLQCIYSIFGRIICKQGFCFWNCDH